MKKTFGIIAVILTVLVISWAVTLLINNDTAYVFLEVNPSLELIVNRNNKIEELIALDSEAEILLSDLNLLKYDLIEAVDIITDEMIKMGYINSESIAIIDINTVSTKEKRNNQLNKAIENLIQKKLDENNFLAEIYVAGVGELIKESAEKYGISSGKMLLVTKAIESGSEKDEEDLVKMSISEIQNEIKTAKHAFNNKKDNENKLLRKEKEKLIKANKKKQ